MLLRHGRARQGQGGFGRGGVGVVLRRGAELRRREEALSRVSRRDYRGRYGFCSGCLVREKMRVVDW